MGRRGPQPLPANVHYLRGNPSKKNLDGQTVGLQPDIEIPGCPPHLLPEAKKEWKRITPLLETYGLISQLDRAALALYCQCWARWVWAEKQLQRAQDLAAKKMAEAEAKGEEYAGGDGLTVTTPNGHVTYSAHWVMSNKAMEQVHRYLKAFGLDPSSRGVVKPSESRQPGLFPEEGDTGGGFGDI